MCLWQCYDGAPDGWRKAERNATSKPDVKLQHNCWKQREACMAPLDIADIFASNQFC